MKTFNTISAIIAVTVGFLLLLCDILTKESTMEYYILFVVVKVIGMILIYIGFRIYENNRVEDDWEDEDMDNLA